MSLLLVSDIIKMAEKQLEAANIDQPRVEAEALYCYLKRVDKSKFFMEWSESADDRTCDHFFDLVAKRCERVPLQHITGVQDFMGIPFKVNEKVLIPRMDTEVVALAAELKLKELKGDSVLDLCCGSGAIGVSLAKRVKGKVTAVDINPDAVALTKENAKNAGVKMEVLEGNLFEPVKKKKYHMIVSNPPYIASDIIHGLMPEVKDHEPLDALDGGEDGLNFYRQIIHEAGDHLKKKGIIVLEIGHDQGQEVSLLLEQTGQFEDIEILDDLAGKNRVIIGKKEKK